MNILKDVIFVKENLDTPAFIEKKNKKKIDIIQSIILKKEVEKG